MKFSEMDHPDGLVDKYNRNLTYEYYLVNNEVPVRMLMQDNGNKLYAEALNWRSKKIEAANEYLNSFNYSDNDDFEKITKEVFYKACDEYLASWTPERIELAEKNIEALKRMIEEEKS